MYNTSITVILAVIVIILFLIGAAMYIYRFGTMLWTKGTPTINTFHRHYVLLKKLQISAGSSLIDLGCGTGDALRFFADNFSNLQLFGVDINKLAIIWGNWRHKNTKWNNISLQYQNIFTVDLQKYDYIYIYLLPTLMPEVEEYLTKHMDKKSIVISNSFRLPTWTSFQHIDDEKGVPKIFLYKRQEKK